VETSSLVSLEEKRPSLLVAAGRPPSGSRPGQHDKTDEVSEPLARSHGDEKERRATGCMWHRTWSSKELEAREWSRDALSKRAGRGRSSSSAARRGVETHLRLHLVADLHHPRRLRGVSRSRARDQQKNPSGAEARGRKERSRGQVNKCSEVGGGEDGVMNRRSIRQNRLKFKQI
jgi:hypothetical protein